MVELEILASPDPEVIGKHQFFFAEIELGTALSCHLPIEDPQLPSKGISLIATSEGMMVKITPPGIFYVNKKEVLAKKLIQPEDKIQIGKTEILLAQYNFETICLPWKDNIAAQNASLSDKEKLFIEALEAELLFLEYEYKERI